MNEAEPSTIVSRKKLLFGGGTVLIIAIVLFVCYLLAGNAATSYNQAFTKWNASQKTAVLKDTSALPEGSYALLAATDSTYTQTLYDKQAKACDAVGSTVKKIEQAKADVPTQRFVLFGGLNSAYRNASKTANERNAKITSYLNKANTTFSQFHTDCTFENIFDAGDLKSDVLYQKAKSYEDPGGTVRNGLSCPVGTTCLSSDPAQLTKDVEQLEAAVKIKAQIIPAVTQNCPKTSIGKLCPFYTKLLTESNTCQMNFNAALRKNISNVASPEVVAARQACTSSDTFQADELTQISKFYPAIKDEVAQANSSDSLVVLNALAKVKLADLGRQAASLSNL